MATVHLLRPAVPDVQDVPDGELALAARGGARWARESLFRRFSGLVYGLAVRLGGPRDAKDVVQDVFVQAFRSLDSLQEPEAIKSWLCGITVRLVRRRLRRHRLVGAVFSRDDSGIDQAISAFASPEVAVDLHKLYGHVKNLPERERTALLLRRVEGMSMEETSQLMEASISSVKRWLASAEERIAKASAAQKRPGK